MSEPQGFLFPFKAFEPKWQERWESGRLFRAKDPGEGGGKLKKVYILDMFPSPSAAGLHVGHPEGYTATDILSRWRRMQGMNVLHPIGWDAFGLPAEQYAIQTGTHPSVATQKNIQNFKKQIKRLGFSYDWDREIDTTDPKYHRWTQWIFLKLFEKGLAYQAEVPVWWCEELGCVLANEEVVDGKSERGGFPVVRRPMRQWILKITAYADRLLADLEGLDWSEAIKEMQKNWIGRSEGAQADFELDVPIEQKIIKSAQGENRSTKITVFTTRPDTLFGATYMVLSPEHSLVSKVTSKQQEHEVMGYKIKAAAKSELERTELTKDKTGVFTGAYAVNPVNGKKIPIWIADYVLSSYGTGAIMEVPAHDERDYAFAKKYKLPIIEVIKGGDISKEAFSGDGVNVNSDFLNGLPTAQAKEKITKWLAEKGLGKGTVNYKLRDWLFSRQRYWGEPIPIVHCAKCGAVPLPENELPLLLPDMKDFAPKAHPPSAGKLSTGEPPLAKAAEWVNTKCPACKGPGKRETNTMPQWAGSCWYYLRYLDPKNDKAFVSKEKEKYWMNVDLYVGGAEHAVLHLLYSRFWHKALFDLGYVSTKEPFRKLVNQGIILGEDGQKMSKSRGNVVNPDDVIDRYGADAMRLYEMFMGPLEQSKAWSMQGAEGVYRFLGKVWRLFVQEGGASAPDIREGEPDADEQRLAHELIGKVTQDLDRMAFNTAISAFMIFVNNVQKRTAKSKKMLETFLVLLSPFAPHIAEELWEKLGHRDGISRETWPVFDPKFVKKDEVELAVQVNGRLRARITVPAGASEAQIKEASLKDEKVAAEVGGKTPDKVIVVPGRLVNIVVK